MNKYSCNKCDGDGPCILSYPEDTCMEPSICPFDKHANPEWMQTEHEKEQGSEVGLAETIRRSQVHAGEMAVIAHLRKLGL